MSSHVMQPRGSTPTHGSPSRAEEIDRKQDEILRQLDNLDADILTLIEEFSVRLNAEARGR